MRYLYSFVLYLILPFILLRLLWRSRHNKQYRKRILERLGVFSIKPEWQQGLWIHAVSLGEVIAATPLIKAIRLHYPTLPITLTTMTITGSARVTATFGNDIFHVYVPYDIPCFLKRFLKRVKPKALIILETELWPNMLALCKAQQIPIMLSNARLSERSFLGYQRIARSTKKMLSAITVLAAHAHADGQRFLQLGLDPAHLFVTGSIKFDVTVPASIMEQAQVLRNMLGHDRYVWVVASTHDGEEEKILQTFKQVLLSVPNLLLLLVPRHPERFHKITELCRHEGYHVVTRTSQQPCSTLTQIFIGDTIGELKLFYAASDLAFVGGSLVPIGGHNILEPASLGIPTITGPYMFNFTEITELLLAEQALIQVQNNIELATAVISLLGDSTLRADMSERAHQTLEKNKGALEKTMRLLEEKILN